MTRRISMILDWGSVTLELRACGWKFVGYTYLWDDKRIVEDEELWISGDGHYILWVNHIDAVWFLYRRIERAEETLRLRGVGWQAEGLFGPDGEGRSDETNIGQIWPSTEGTDEHHPDNWRFLKVEAGDGVYYYELCASGDMPEDAILLECGG